MNITRMLIKTRIGQWAKKRYHRLKDMRSRFECYLYDARRADRMMNWQRADDAYGRISAELFFWYHKLEKGLCLPEPRRFFGLYPAEKTLELMRSWRDCSFDLDDPVYVGAVETLRAYQQVLVAVQDPDREQAKITSVVEQVIQHSSGREDLSTPIRFDPQGGVSIGQLEDLATARRSVRSFTSQPVAVEEVERAVKVAQMSPSACNRQPCKVHFYTDKEKVQELLRLQNGNSGFNHTIPALVVLTAEARAFKDPTERNQLFVDSGLFLMSFLYALQVQGVSSCCLNWCVAPDQDRKALAAGAIPDGEWIITFLAVGRHQPGTIVPRSPRRMTRDVLINHDYADA